MENLQDIIGGITFDWRFLIGLAVVVIIILNLCKPKVSLNKQTNQEHPQFDLQPYRTDFELFEGGPIISFIGTPSGEEDRVRQVDPNTGRVEDAPAKNNLSSTKASYGSVAIDLNKDGFTDLLVAREDGVYYHKNNDTVCRPFGVLRIMEKKPGLTPFHLTIHDFNRDGNPDIYVRQMDDATGTEGPAAIIRFYQNNEFVDVTEETGPVKLNFEKQSDEPSGNCLQVKFPATIDYAGARVAVIIGQNMYVKYNLIGTGQTQLLTFNLPYNFVDKVKIRTIYNKDYNYIEPPLNQVLKIEPMTHFDQSNNRWRSTTSAS